MIVRVALKVRAAVSAGRRIAIAADEVRRRATAAPDSCARVMPAKEQR